MSVLLLTRVFSPGSACIDKVYDDALLRSQLNASLFEPAFSVEHGMFSLIGKILRSAAFSFIAFGVTPLK